LPLQETLSHARHGRAHPSRCEHSYQGIFGELYRRFGVASYKLIRVEQYDPVLVFLESWRAAGSAEPPEKAG
jgi:hypothetical protein